MNKYILCLILSVVFHFPIQAQTIEFAVSEWPPVEYSVNGAARGYHPDIIRAVFLSMGMNVKFSFFPWKRCLSMVQQKQVQGILSLQHTQEREAYLIFPKENISVSENLLFVIKGKEFKADKISDLAGKRIGVSAGYNYGSDFTAASNQKLFISDEGRDDELGFKKLAAGRFDAFICDKVVGWGIVKSLGLKDRVTVLPFAVSSVKMYVGFAKSRENGTLAEKFDIALKKMKQSGEWQRIIDSYLKYDMNQ